MSGKRIGYNPLNTIPRDITAKKVVYDEGDHYECNAKISTASLYSTESLPIRKLKELPSHIINDPNFKDWTGFKFGNFTVIGIFALDKYNKWVCRCCCGCYEIRTATALNKNKTAIDATRCGSCMDLERLRSKEFFKKHGYYPWQEKKKK